jgi:hypothetical protein
VIAALIGWSEHTFDDLGEKIMLAAISSRPSISSCSG